MYFVILFMYYDVLLITYYKYIYCVDSMKGPDGTIAMMQIDCDVMDTKYIHVERSVLQPAQYDLRIALP